MTNFTHVYLSGGMEYAENEGRDWRQEMHDWLEERLKCRVFNPNVESDRFFARNYPHIDIRALKEKDIVTYAAIVAKLVEIDCKEIAERSELVICYWDDSAMRGAGTKGELTMAKYFGKPVYMVTAMPYTEIPGWVLGCTTLIFSSFEELKEFLLL
ncbi:hypothetical protein FBQ87_14535 [Sphingobacteriales bacterium CHB3]|nr:hypothetical protein [Sphingobacteriales bacterium CHB3]